MQEEAVTQHHWLKKFVGEWEYSGECPMGPGGEMSKFTGVERVRAVGGLWIVGESTGNIPGGGEATMILTVGFNPKTGRFVGTWVGSMMAHLWVYDGWLDDAGATLTLEAQGPCMQDPAKTRTYRDITEFKSDDHRVFRAQMQNDQGEWEQMMTMEVRRKKS